MRTILSIVFILLFLPSCASTGQLGSKDRKQLMLVSENSWHSNATKAYEKNLKQAKSKNVLVIDKRLEKIIQKLIPSTDFYRLGASHWDWKIRAQLNGEMNAYGFASGKILINTGLYWHLNLNDDELAFVIAHEMAHALRDHSREKMSASLLFGSLPTYARYGVSQVWLHEQEADLIALNLMSKANFKPEAALSFWQKYDLESERRRNLKTAQTLMSKDLLQYRIDAIQTFLTQIQHQHLIQLS
jgi:Zn-dependent protease with chaperone function